MPARIAATPPDEQIKEIIGSGPFKFARDEWQPGEQVVYVRNPDYIPRDEAPSGSTGGKKVYLDKVIWRYIPDPWEAAEALATAVGPTIQVSGDPPIRQDAAEAARPTDARGGAGFEIGSVGPIDCWARNGFYPPSYRDPRR